MAAIPQFTLKSGDLRRIARQIEQSASEIKSEATQIIERHARSAASELRRRVSAPKTGPTSVAGRTGRLAASVGYELFDTQYTAGAYVGFINFLDIETLMAARVHTGSVNETEWTLITPVKGDFLAFPPYDTEDELPIPIRASNGRQLMTASEARERYQAAGYTTYMAPKKDPRFIFARPESKGGKKKKIDKGEIAGGSIGTGPHKNLKGQLLLFHVRRSVLVRKRIDLEEIRDTMQSNIIEDLQDLVERKLG